jgi:hypothetical protein
MNTQPTNRTRKPTAKQIEKRKQQAARMDKKIAQNNIKNHEALAFGIAALVAKNPRIEFEIVSNYLKRTGQCLTGIKEYNAQARLRYPSVAHMFKD